MADGWKASRVHFVVLRVFAPPFTVGLANAPGDAQAFKFAITG